MKKIFLIFALFSVSACTTDIPLSIETVAESRKIPPDAQLYYEDIKKCDDEYNIKSDLPENSTTVGITKTIAEQAECYESIARKIIDKNYSHNSDDMKKDLAIYIDISGTIVGEILRPDNCYPYCGTIVGNRGAIARRNAAREYLEMLIKEVYFPEIY